MNAPLGKTDEPKVPRAPALVDYESCWSSGGSSERWRWLKEQLVHWELKIKEKVLFFQKTIIQKQLCPGTCAELPRSLLQ